MKLLRDTNLSNVLFLDIETAPSVSNPDELTGDFSRLWEKKSAYFRTEEESPLDVWDRAGIYAEFGKIICISVGFIRGAKDTMSIRLKSFYGDDEKALLEDFAVMLNNFSSGRDPLLCAHNGKEFDYPYIARRMLINGLTIPGALDNAGKKPWEINLLDTMELWKFGDYKNYTSLNLLTNLFGIPTPKDDIDGSMVAEVYWKDKDIDRIGRYCEKDVVATIQLFLKFRGDKLVPAERIESVTFPAG